MMEFTPSDAVAEPAVEILLVQRDQRQCELTLDVIQSRHLANRIHVLRDGAEALEFLFRTGAYADRQPVNPRLLLFHLRLAEGDDIEVLRRIRDNPQTAEIPITVLASSADDRVAAMSELHDYDLHLPVVVIARPMPKETVHTLESVAGGAVAPQLDAQTEDEVVVVPGDDAVETLCLERDLDTLIRTARAAAHEFNNLFSVIVAYTELLLKDVDFDDPRRAGADEIFRAISRASKITRDLLTFRPAAERDTAVEGPSRPSPARPSGRPARPRVA